MPSANEMLKEVYDRTRRIETRLTADIEERGGSLKVDMPIFGVVGELPGVDVPTPASRFKDILDVIPDDYVGRRMEVYCRGKLLAIVVKQDAT